MELRLQYIHDDDKNWFVRICMLVSEANPNFIAPESEQRPCMECDRPIWYDTRQKLPVVPGLIPDGEVWICINCMALHQSMSADPPKWI